MKSLTRFAVFVLAFGATALPVHAGTPFLKTAVLRDLNFSDSVVTVDAGAKYEVDYRYGKELQARMATGEVELRPGMSVEISGETVQGMGASLLGVVNRIEPVGP